MVRHFTLEYWIDDDWYVGRLKKSRAYLARGNPCRSWKTY